jgi:hypothetical protein
MDWAYDHVPARFSYAFEIYQGSEGGCGYKCANMTTSLTLAPAAAEEVEDVADDQLVNDSNIKQQQKKSTRPSVLEHDFDAIAHASCFLEKSNNKKATSHSHGHNHGHAHRSKKNNIHTPAAGALEATSDTVSSKSKKSNDVRSTVRSSDSLLIEASLTDPITDSNSELLSANLGSAIDISDEDAFPAASTDITSECLSFFNPLTQTEYDETVSNWSRAIVHLLHKTLDYI